MPTVNSKSLFEIVDFQLDREQVLLNRYWYISNEVPDTISASLIATAFEAIIDAWLPQLQDDGVEHTTIKVDEVTSISNFIERASAIGDGELTGPNLPTFTSAPIRLYRTTKETRSGWKRIRAGTENEQLGNGWTTAFLSDLNDFAAVLNDQLTTVSGDADPCIVRKTYDSGSGELNPPSDWIYNLVASAEALGRVTTQNSRKSF